MIEVYLMVPSSGGLPEYRDTVILPGVPRVGETVRFYVNRGPRLMTVREVIWDTHRNMAEVRA